MIGKITTGKSFYHCIAYCLEDKRNLSEQDIQQLSQDEGLHHKDRAEVLEFNLCYGDKWELAEQFRDVQKLSKRVEKSVMHLSIRVAPGEQLTPEQWREIGREAAREFGLEKHQYICVLHKDTTQSHIHVVGNRVGYDGKVASDSHSYARMAALCRKLENKYQLKQVLSPRRYLSEKERQIPRQDQRKERLKEKVRQALKSSRTYAEFEKKIRAKGYQVDKGRGIAFEDDKKVRIKGSEVGYSLATIERILAQNQQTQLRESNTTWQQEKEKQALARQIAVAGMHRANLTFTYRSEQPAINPAVAHGLSKLIQDLMKPEHSQPGQGHDPWEEEQRRKQKKKRRLHL